MCTVRKVHLARFSVGKTLLRSLVLLLALGAAALAGPVYNFTDFAFQGATNNFVYAINNSGYVSGDGYSANWSDYWGEVCHGTTCTTLVPPGSTGMWVFRLNNAGTVVGGFGYPDDPAGVTHGVIYQAGTYTVYSDAVRQPELGFTAINDTGLIVGHYGFMGNDVGMSFLYNGVTAVDLTDPNGVVTNPDVQGINDAGVMVGYYGPGLSQSFIYAGGVFTPVAYPGATSTQLNDINNLGWAIGNWSNGSGGGGGFLYKDGVFVPLPNMIVPAPWGPWVVIPNYMSINDYGVVAGWHGAYDANGNWYLAGFTGDPIPEPGTWALVWAGIVALAALRRRTSR